MKINQVIQSAMLKHSKHSPRVFMA